MMIDLHLKKYNNLAYAINMIW